MKKNIKKIIGYCGVDSGQLLVIDPCYLSKWKDGEFDPNKKLDNSYARACELTCGDGQECGGEVQEGGVVFASGYGDGNYPVIATYNKDRRIIKIEIKMN
jgi:hypothetical protein